VSKRFEQYKKKEDDVSYIDLKAGELLFKEGDASRSIFIVQQGQLRIFRDSYVGKVELGLVGERQIVGEMAFISESPRSATVEAVVDTRVIELDTKLFNTYIKSQPPWLKLMIESLVFRVRSANDKLIY